MKATTSWIEGSLQRLDRLLIEDKLQELTETINRAHSLHRERHERTKMYRAVCSCGWHSPEFIRTGDYNAARTDHLSEIIEKAVKTIRSHE